MAKIGKAIWLHLFDLYLLVRYNIVTREDAREPKLYF